MMRTYDQAPETEQNGADRSRAAKRRPVHLPTIRVLATIVVILVAWEILAGAWRPVLQFFPPLSILVGTGLKLAQSGELWTHIWISVMELLLGLGVASLVGILLGFALAQSRILRECVSPLVSALASMPVAAFGLTTLLIVQFGLGIEWRAAFISLLAVFLIMRNTITGLSSTHAGIIAEERLSGAMELQTLTKARLRASLPMILAGIRLAVPWAVVGEMYGGLMGARGGLGFLFHTSMLTFVSARALVAVAILVVLGAVPIVLLN